MVSTSRREVSTKGQNDAHDIIDVASEHPVGLFAARTRQR
jgi:hypothetical protein